VDLEVKGTSLRVTYTESPSTKLLPPCAALIASGPRGRWDGWDLHPLESSTFTAYGVDGASNKAYETTTSLRVEVHLCKMLVPAKRHLGASYRCSWISTIV
jgi:hypothetical protein